MMTKSYLFAAVTSTLLLVLVVPILNDRTLVPSEIASIAALSVISIAIGGLTSEVYVLARGKKAMDFSNDAKKYFVSLNSSLLFLAIVAPSIQSAFRSASFEDIVAVAVLFILTLALAGLTAQGFFAIISWASGKKTVWNGSIRSLRSPANSSDLREHSEANLGPADEIDSRFKALESAVDTSLKEMKHQLLSAIHDAQRGPSNEIETTPARDHIVEALLGKSKTGGN